jgi:D-alanyl-lipoteichoic acid acyltransferase DltB (MBOAT superfamily)
MSVVKVLLILLAVWIVMSVLGLIVKGLLWLFVLGCVAFAVTSLVGAARRRGRHWCADGARQVLARL